MAGMCILSPLVNGEKSRLYDELLDFTGKDRKLTNFLYALSLQDDIKDQFSKKQFNSQGELQLNDFVKKFNLKEFIPEEAELNSAKRELGVVDSKGETIKYDTPDELYDKVRDFNNSTRRFRATIGYEDGKFIIKLDRTNAGNFRNNEVLETRLAQFNGINKFLRESGFGTEYSPETVSLLANFNNVKYFENSLVDLSSSTRNLSIARAHLIMDLLAGRPFLDRVRNALNNSNDNEIAEILSIVSSDREDARVDNYTKSLINNFLDYALNEFRKLDFNEMDAAKKEFTDQIKPSENNFFEVSSDLLNKTLKELYEDYHLNQDILAEATGALDSLSKIAERLFGLSLTRMDISQNQGENVKEDRRQLTKAKKQLDNGRYVESIYSFLRDLFNEFDGLEQYFVSVKEQAINTDRTTDTDLKKINEMSKYIYMALSFIEKYQPVIDVLVKADSITLDQPDLPKEILYSIRDIATKTNTLFADVRSKARDAQFEVVVAFLSIGSWGTEDVKKMSSGDELSLRAIVQDMTEDPNMFDRFIYSINESNDAGLGLIHNTIKERYRKRDARLRSIEYIIRDMTDALHAAGGKSSDMYERDSKGIPTGRLKSYVDNLAYERAKNDYIKSLREQGIRGAEFDKRMREWTRENRKTEHTPFDGKNEIYNKFFREYCMLIYGEMPKVLNPKTGKMEEAGYATDIPNPDIYGSSELESMSSAEYEYYSKMIALKAALTLYTPDTLNLFDAVQISGDILNAIGETGGDPAKALQLLKNKFKDAFSRREDDSDFGECFGDVLEANGMRKAVMDLNGGEFMQIPLLFTHMLKDPSRLSTDLSRSMLAYAQTTMQYYEMNQIADALTLTADYFNTQRKAAATSGGKSLVNMVKMGGDVFMRSITKDSTTSSGILSDLYEREIYGRKKNDNGKKFTFFGVEIDSNKAIDWAIGYTSRTGLAVNYLGAQANLFVGKVQMVIEGWAGEFFNMKNLGKAEVKYFQYLWDYLSEYSSNNKKSFMALFSDRFDVMEDFYQELRDKGFHKSAIGKILGNSNLFMLYGMGEHLLHLEGAFAVCDNVKLYDKKTTNTVTFLQALEQSYKNNVEAHPGAKNLQFTFDMDRYEMYEGEENTDGTQRPHRPMTEDDVLKIEKKITYVNKTMHGAFNELEKGLAARYAVGRALLNFRQWMPGHYQRRFRGLHYDADLGDMRRGYYSSLWKFLGDCIKDFKDRRVQIATRWNELSPMDKYNLRRVTAELTSMMMLSIANLSLGEYKDKKGSWAYRNLMYQVKRVLMETKASTPFPDLISVFSGRPADMLSFVNNIYSVLKSPAAVINTVESLSKILNLSNLLFTVQGGKDMGENLYLHNLKREAPYVGSWLKQNTLVDEDWLFQMFDK